MQKYTQAEIFITTLEDVLDAERELRRVQALSQQKANAKRYIQAFPAVFDDSRAPSEWFGSDHRQGWHAGMQMQTD